MEVDEAVTEACERWGEAAAIYKNKSRRQERYEVGYFKRESDGLVFHVMGSGSTLEGALTSAHAPTSNVYPAKRSSSNKYFTVRTE